MQQKNIISASIIFSLLSGCVGSSVATKEEIEKQNKADSIVADVLFENELV